MKITGGISRRSRVVLVTLILVAVVVGVLLASGEGNGEAETQLFLITFHESVDRALVEEYGGEVWTVYRSTVYAWMTSEAAEALAEHEAVRYVEADFPVYPAGQDVPWGIDRVFGDEEYPFDTWDISTGEGVGLAVLDTGIDGDHEDLPELADGTNTYDHTPWDYDGDGHGTAVAGIIAAQDNGLGVVGVAPGVALYSVKVMLGGYGGSASSVSLGIDWVVSEAEASIPIINMSLAFPEGALGLDILEAACDSAYEQGYLLIAAAGNQASAVRYPAAFESVIPVSASTADGSFWWQSNRGPEIHLSLRVRTS